MSKEDVFFLANTLCVVYLQSMMNKANVVLIRLDRKCYAEDAAAEYGNGAVAQKPLGY